jgi:RimJ/RimL family protein N-acetyltransferase
MNLVFKEFEITEKEQLAEFLSSEKWDFYREPVLSKETVIEKVNKNHYSKNGIKTFWITDESNVKIGMIRLFDLGENQDSDETPLFDIRIKNSMRGNGIGTEAVRWLISYVFRNYPNKTRFEATTRFDNKVMRRVLERCGFVKEAHYRQAWPDGQGNKHDCAGYGILRNDWLANTITPVEWEK